MKIQEYLIEGARYMFNLHLKEAESNLAHPDYARVCIKKMEEIRQDMLLFEQLGLIGEKESASFAIDQAIKGLENKLKATGIN